MTEATPLVDAMDVVRLVGPPAFTRAKDYVRLGFVLEHTFDAATQSLTGLVQGSGPAPYSCRVTLIPARGDYSRPVGSTCTCPVGGDCKHVAALLVASNADAVAAHASRTTPGSGTGSSAGENGGGADGPDDWRATVRALAEATPPAPLRTVELGLQFELREQVRPAAGRWQAPTWRTAGTVAAPRVSTVRRLGVRPVRKSPTGNWVKGDLTWASLPYQQNRLGMDPDQHRWFVQFAALHRSARDAYGTTETEWLALDDFASPLLWALLAEGERLGLAFVTGKKSPPAGEPDVSLAARARIGVDVSHEPGRDLVLTATVAIDAAGAADRAAPSAEAPGTATRTAAGDAAEALAESSLADPSVRGTVADHGVYLWHPGPKPRVTLAPTASPVTDEQRRLVTGASTITVPDADAAEFVRDFYPRLTSTVDVVSRDASVALPRILPPRLVLTATFAPADEPRTGERDRDEPDHDEPERDELQLTWAWRVAGAFEPAASRPVPAGSDGDELDTRTRSLTGIAAATFAAEELPALEQRPDIDVVIEGPRPDYRELTEPPTMVVTTVETDKRDWFDLGVLVTVEGRTVPFGPLFTALTRHRDKLLLPDKTYLSLLHPAFDELRRLIDEAEALDEWQTGTIRINRYQVDFWEQFEDLADETVQAPAWQAAVDGLLAQTRGTLEATPVPLDVQAELRPYQVEGFSWLAFLHDHGLGGVLADDMGLGKTLQTLALFAHARASARATGVDGGPFLVVAPTSVVSNWAAEATRFTPGLTVRTVTTTETKGRMHVADLAHGADVVVTSYALFRLDFASYSKTAWSGLVLDEAQFIKNRTSKAHKAAVDLDTPWKLAITGTPLENSLHDLWSLFRVVAPGLLSSGTRFSEDFVKPISSGERPDLMATLQRRIRPLMLRRTKELVASELPEKQEQVLRVDLAPAHRELYDAYLQRERQKLLGLMEDLDRNRFIVFRSLTLLRLLALDASLVDPEYGSVPSSKLDALLEEIVDVVAGGHRALIFSQFTSYLGKVRDRLDERGFDYEYLDGSTLRRQEAIDRFKEGSAPLFLISLKAGGFGLNLTEADYVFLLDPWWNPAAESQAIDRTHRIGQTRNVMVYRMIANDTIEEKVMALQQQKSMLFDAVMDDEAAAFGAALTADDLRGLLG